MYVYGGVYADLDFEALKPLDGLLHNSSLSLAMEGEGLNGDGNLRLANSILASSPGHPFWIHLLTNIIMTLNAKDAQQLAALHPIDVTGPDAVSRAHGEFSRVQGLPIDIVPTGVLVKGYAQQVDLATRPCIYQGEDKDVRFNKSACIAENAGAYTVTYWTGSWGGR
ncbi:g4253 [Coccomyxa viridis]|uniref:G4253 protein n=1 Tax=Coccomyxa viridis TaxID=1274662 RepID=A0ABP1FPX0_9CHLO